MQCLSRLFISFSWTIKSLTLFGDGTNMVVSTPAARACNQIYPTLRRYSWNPAPSFLFRGGQITNASTVAISFSSQSTGSISYSNQSGIPLLEPMESKRNVSTIATVRRLRRHDQTRRFRVYLAVGSNLGNCFHNMHNGLVMLCDPNFHHEMFLPTNFVKSSFLYQTAPMYVTNQPSFWNGVVEIATDMDPHSMLKRLKLIEQEMGRVSSLTDPSLKNGPRPLDLDILLYYDNENFSDGTQCTSLSINSEELVVPHPRIQEREFVLRPLADVTGRTLIHPSTNTTVGELLDWIAAGYQSDDEAAVRILPLPRGRSLKFNQTHIMGILNVTPDSFSDGGRWNNVDLALNRGVEMIAEGATIIDIGGESTRPGAAEVSVEEQIDRTVPVIRAIRERTAAVGDDVVLSIDTRHADVARAAIEAGADIVNDVSGGTFDVDMLDTVADLNVPIVLMHMRGTPETMQSLTDYDDDGGVVNSVVNSLREQSQSAERAGIPSWMQVLDLGIGFAKEEEGNLLLLKNYGRMRSEMGNFPLLLGTSRKGFIGKISGEKVAKNRDYGTVGSCVAALCLGRREDASGRMSLGCNILRVHNVKAAKEALVVVDAIVKAE